MKKTILPLFTGALLSSSLFATDFVVSTPNSTVGLPTGDLGDLNIYYTGADKSTSSSETSTRARIGSTNIMAAPYAMNSLTLKAPGLSIDGATSTTPGYWNLLGNFDIDIASSEGVATAIKNESTTRISYQLGTINIKNSQEGGTALIDLGASTMTLSGGANDSQTPSLNIYVDTEIKTNDPALTSNSKSLYLGVASSLYVVDSKLTLNCRSTIGGNAEYEAYVNVDSTSTLLTKGKVDLKNYSTVVVDGLWEMNTGGAELDSGAYVSVKKLTQGGGNTIKAFGGTFEVGSATTFVQLEMKNGGVINQTAGDTTKFTRHVTVSDGGTFSTKGVLYLEAGSTDATSAKWANITINDGANFYVDGVSSSGTAVILKNGSLILNKKNAITTSDGKAVQMVSADSGTNINIMVNASQEFTGLMANKSTMKYYLADDASVILASDFSNRNDGIHAFYDFDENRIFVRNWESLAEEKINSMFEAYQNVDGEYVKVDTLYIHNGWLSAFSTAVPEPAEWAMILGALALGLAVYRKRK